MTPEQAKRFKYWQTRTILATMVGYALFYFVRKNFSLAMPGLEADLGISKTSLGVFLTLNGLVYGFSRFLNGILADRMNARWYMAVGLALCALAVVMSILAAWVLPTKLGLFAGGKDSYDPDAYPLDTTLDSILPQSAADDAYITASVFAGDQYAVTLQKDTRITLNQFVGQEGLQISKALSTSCVNFASDASSYTIPQAIPKKAVINPEYCRQMTKGKCGVCAKVCPTGAIKYDMQDEVITEEVGCIVAATGYDLMDWTIYEQYGGGKYPDVITSLQYERLLSASGPTEGHIKRPSDGKEPQSVVFIQCVGSRDKSIGRPYCSGFCCMYTAKQAVLTKDHIPTSQSYVFYMDIRAPSKLYDEFTRRAIEEYGTEYIRGRVSKIYPDGNGQYIVKGVDTLLGQPVEIRADLVVLAVGIEASKGSPQLAEKLRMIQLPAYLCMLHAAGFKDLHDAALVELRDKGREYWLFGPRLDLDNGERIRQCFDVLSLLLWHMEHGPDFTGRPGEGCRWCDYQALCHA